MGGSGDRIIRSNNGRGFSEGGRRELELAPSVEDPTEDSRRNACRRMFHVLRKRLNETFSF